MINFWQRRTAILDGLCCSIAKRRRYLEKLACHSFLLQPATESPSGKTSCREQRE